MTGFRGLCLALGFATATAGSVTPVQKVTELLGNLAKKVEQEGKDDAAAYDKYSCFCKEESDDKLYAIETSTERIAKLTAKIGKLGTEITDLDGEIQDLGLEITRLEGEMLSKKQARDAAHGTYLTNHADAKGALDAVERAIQAMEDSKKAQIGHVELEAPGLAQVAVVAKTALLQRKDLSESDIDHLSFLAGQPGKAYTYKYKSNDIIATLENLRTTFDKRKATLEGEEFEAQSAYEMTRQDLSNQKKFAEKDQREKTAVREAKADEKEAAELDKTNEVNDKASDQAFLDVLQTNCEEAAGLWDQRSRTRAAELTAIDQAMEALKTGVAPNWQANKKLAGLQKRSVVKGHWVYVDDSAPAKRAAAPMAFLQVQSASLRGSAQTQNLRADAQVASRVHDLLVRSAEKLHSPYLTLAALKVHAAEDHFVKVRQIIKDLIQHLEDQASAEDTQKQFCDRQMSSAVDRRDQQQATVEDLKSQINSKESAKAQLKSEVAALAKQIAENKKALHEATVLRQEEHADNTKTVQDAGAGKAAVELALNLLNNFYNPQLLQKSVYVPPNSDREGLTVADRAPQIFDAEYHGGQDASKGIIGMLEVILADFDRTGTVVDGQEQAAVGRFNTFETSTNSDTDTKQGFVDTKEGEISGIDDDLVTLADSLASAVASHKIALGELESLHSMCVAGEETYEERIAQRQKEIEALKEAHGILEDWQK